VGWLQDSGYCSLFVGTLFVTPRAEWAAGQEGRREGTEGGREKIAVCPLAATRFSPPLPPSLPPSFPPPPPDQLRQLQPVQVRVERCPVLGLPLSHLHFHGALPSPPPSSLRHPEGNSVSTFPYPPSLPPSLSAFLTTSPSLPPSLPPSLDSALVFSFSVLLH